MLPLGGKLTEKKKNNTDNIKYAETNNMCRVMRNPAFCICENKGADQLHSNNAADQRLCFCYIVQFLYFLKQIFKPLAIFCCCKAPFVSDLDGNTKDRFSHYAAHML